MGDIEGLFLRALSQGFEPSSFIQAPNNEEILAEREGVSDGHPIVEARQSAHEVAGAH